MTINESIRKIRKSENMTQKEYAKKIGISPVLLSRIEKGHSRPSTAMLGKMSRYHQCPIPILLLMHITVDDVSEEKKAVFNAIKPTIDRVLMDLFF